MKALTVPVDEYALLHEIYLEALKVRDQGVQKFNRFSPEMRLAITSLAARYRDQGNERSIPHVMAAEPAVKHVDCSCAECRARLKPQKKAAPKTNARITIPLADAATVIADSVRAVLDAHSVSLGKYRPAWAELLNEADTNDLIEEIGNNTAAALQGLDETPLELPAPVAIRRVRK